MGRFGHSLPATTFVNEKEEVPTTQVIQAMITNNAFSQFPNIQDIDSIPVTDGHIRGEEVVRDKGKEIGRSKDKQELREKQAQLPGADLPGFMPLREDFDIEHDNDAEVLLADMEFLPDDHPSERELKLQVIRIYNAKLDERNKRKRFVIDRGLVDFKKQQNQEKRRSKEEKELVARLRVFARFHSSADHDSLVDGLLKARRLHKQIEMYQHYRRMGIRTLEQAQQYEIDRKRRDGELKARKMRENTPYLFEDGRNGSSGSGSGVGVLGPPLANGNGNTRRGRGRGLVKDNDAMDEIGASSSSSSVNLPSLPSICKVPIGSFDLDDITQAPGADLLTDCELKLCHQASILPMHFIAAKEAIIREAYRNGTLTESGVGRVLKYETSKCNMLFDFFVREMKLPHSILSEKDKDKGIAEANSADSNLCDSESLTGDDQAISSKKSKR